MDTTNHTDIILVNYDTSGEYVPDVVILPNAPKPPQWFAEAAEQIDRAVSEGQVELGNALQKFSEAGRVLVEVKKQLGHGQFGEWIKQNCKVEHASVNNYMRLHSNWQVLEDMLRSGPRS
jgi:hypothetical protein